MEPVVSLVNVAREFEPRRHQRIVAVDRISLQVQKGEVFSLVGPDGAGKTTTIRMMCGVLPPTDGTIEILGLDLQQNKEEIKRRIGYLSQRFSLYADLTIDENIDFFAEIHNVGDYRKRKEDLLRFTRLTPFRDRLAGKLSGGMKQKLALACTLVHTPDVIFLDEPTTGVDPVSRRDFWKILSDLLKSDITIIMSTPYLDEAERCTRVGLMHEGSLMVVDTPANVKKLLRGDLIEIIPDGNIHEAAVALRTSSTAREVQAFGDRLHVLVDRGDRDVPVIQRELRRAGFAVAQWRPLTPTLENVFISLMSRRQGNQTA